MYVRMYVLEAHKIVYNRTHVDKNTSHEGLTDICSAFDASKTAPPLQSSVSNCRSSGYLDSMFRLRTLCHSPAGDKPLTGLGEDRVFSMSAAASFVLIETRLATRLRDDDSSMKF